MDIESKEQFQNRLSNWVARQGLLFQLRYSMSGGGINILAHHFLIIILKFIGFGFLCGLIFFIYLVSRPNTDDFKAELRESIISTFACDKAIVDGFKHSQSKGTFRYFNLIGGPKSFFSTVEATGVSCSMSILHGFTNSWDAKQISIDRFSMHVRSGSESDQEAKAIGELLFHDNPRFYFESISIKNARFRWGYSERAAGAISGCQAIIIKEGNGYKINITGGTFEQNWLQKLHITKMTLKVQGGGVSIEDAELIPEVDTLPNADKSVKSSVTFHQVKVIGGARPAFSGTIRLKSVALESLTASLFHPFIGGRVSGELKLSGSTNTNSGIAMEGRLSLQNEDSISLKSRLPIISTLSLINPAANLQRIVFTEGYFQVKTKDGVLAIDDVYLSAPDLMDLRGDLQARAPNKKEVEQMLAKNEIDAEIARDLSPTIIEGTKDQMLYQLNATTSKKTSNSLFEGNISKQDVKSITPFLKENEMIADEQLRNERLTSSLIFSGKLSLKFASALFDAKSAMFQKSTISSDKTKLQLDVPIDGTIHELTLKQAENLLEVDDRLKQK